MNACNANIQLMWVRPAYRMVIRIWAFVGCAIGFAKGILSVRCHLVLHQKPEPCPSTFFCESLPYMNQPSNCTHVACFGTSVTGANDTRNQCRQKFEAVLRMESVQYWLRLRTWASILPCRHQYLSWGRGFSRRFGAAPW